MSNTGHLPELDALRSQVADLSRELAERDRALREQSRHVDREMQDLRERSALLRSIVEGTAADTGDEFFASLVTHLTSTLQVRYAVIGEVLEGRLKKIRTVAVSAGDALIANFEYELAQTPCETTLTQPFACFDHAVQQSFPLFHRLPEFGVESYCGVPLQTKGGAVMGLLVVMDTKPLRDSEHIRSLLGVFAPRVAAEFQRKRAEQERAQALADLKNIMETVPDFLFTLDTKGSLVRWNNKVERVTGYSADELLNKSALAFVPPEEQERTAVAIQQVFMNGYAELEGHLLTKEGRTIPYHWTGAALKVPDGRIIGISGVGRDVSEKKRAERELQEQRRHLLTAQALAHLGSWEWDIDSGKVVWSEEQYRIFGHEPGSIAVTDDTILTALHPEDHDRVLAAVNDALLAKRPCEVECRIVRPNGEVRTIHYRAEIHQGAAGHPFRMDGTCLDITDRNHAEEALRASEERWKLAVRGTSGGIWDWNIPTDDVFFSTRWKAMRGFEDHEITNHVDEWRSRIHPDDLERVLQSVDAYLAKQTYEFSEEYRVQRKDGSYMWILDRGVALWADDNTPLRMVGSETNITDRKQAEKALRESEERLRSFMMNSPSPVFFKSLDGCYFYVNPVFERMFQLPAGLIIDKTDYDVFSPEQAEQYTVNDQRVLQEGHAIEFEETAKYQDGIHTCLIVKFPLRSADGSVSGLGGIVTDITARKQMEEVLRTSQEKLRQTLQASSTGLWDWNTETNDVSLSREWKRQLGYNEAELPDAFETWETRLHPDDHARAMAYVQTYLATPDGNYQQEFRLRHKDGTYRWIEARASFVTEPDGRRVRLLGSHTDITTRKQMEETLRVSEERYARATAIGRVGVWELNVATGTYYGDVNLKALFGYEGDELSTDPYVWLNLVHPDDQSIALDRWQRIVTGEMDHYKYELRMIRKDGTVIWTDVRGHAVRDQDGHLTHLIGATVDITERKRVENALRQRERDLRTAVEERERISQDLHDGILQSLYAVGLGLESCKPLMRQRKHKQATARLEQAITQMNQLMTEVRNFIAGIESQVIQGGEFSTALRTMIQTMTASQAVRCRILIDSAATHLVSTEQALHLMNVVREALSNSLRHSQARTIRVSLKVLLRSVRLSVADNGRGFNPATARGIGHGLRNMAARAQKIGGRFAIRSKPKHGTLVIFDLPKEAPLAHV